MAAEILTPTCEATGLPLPIQPIELRENNGALFFSGFNYHHHFAPEYHPDLRTYSGRIMRFSRGQYLPIASHRNFNKLYGEPTPQIPHSEDDKFKIITFACAGVIPRKAINPMSGEEENLTEKEYEHLSRPDVTYIEGAQNKFTYTRYRRVRKRIGSYFANHALTALSDDMSGIVSKKVIDGFLSRSTSPERKKELGNYILHTAINESVTNLSDEHQELQREGYVSRNCHRKLGRIIVSNFFPKDKFPDYYSEVSLRLSTAGG